MFCYHGSSFSGLKILKPVMSTHRVPYVYAVKNKVLSALFLSKKCGDLVCSIGCVDKIPYIYERFDGAFDYAYTDVSGSIYKLSDKYFEEGKTSWEEEIVSSVEVDVISECRIEDVKDYILNFSDKELKFYSFDNRPEFISEDKSDLVERGVIWYSFDKNIIKQFERFHPDLVDRIITQIEVNKNT